VTIGGRKGENGKRLGGSPVFIRDGRIVKGHPSLVDKKPSEIKGGDTDHGSGDDFDFGKNVDPFQANVRSVILGGLLG
jgi:hypothetical protein